MPTPEHVRQILEVEMLPFCAGCHVQDRDFGPIVTHPAFSILYDANLVLLRRLPEGMRLADLEAEVRPVFEEAGASHLRFILQDPALAETLGPRFLEAGYRHNRYLLMEATRPAGREPVPDIRLHPVLGPTGHAVLDRIEAELMTEVPWNSPLIRAALRTRRREISDFLDLRWFWASMASTPAGSIGLLRAGPIASIQAVSTRPAFRKRAVATTMVLELLALARGLGHQTISLMTEAEDWPKDLYGRLGFETVGFAESFLKDEWDAG
jgi:GNAT superfamily N-acetyltransferase